MSIEDVCGEIIELTNEDFVEQEDWYLKQSNSRTPFEATNPKVRKLGQHNLKTLKLIKEMQLHLKKTAALESEL
ncbi:MULTISPECIES: hypothetical protein [unclassified Psychrobacter]|uniref:hypothetical protein n=1 Tax=unclassified Psychrobacter TaxID=196806 RepID=UPI003FD4A0D0